MSSFESFKEEDYDSLNQDQLYSCYTDIVEVMADHVTKLNKLDDKREKILKILKRRSGEEIENEEISDSD
jgi:hypothetical protein